MKKIIFFSLMVLCLSACSGKKDVLMFSYFKGEADGLYLAYSYDGLKWEQMTDTVFIKPEIGGKLMRDPSLAEGPDGTYHLVWTTGWDENNIGHSSTKDFKNWTDQQLIEVMADYPQTINTWAPEITYNPSDGYYYIYWASRMEDSHNDFEIYYTKTKDFDEFTPTDVFYYEGSSLIDAALLKNDSGKGWYFFYKDATNYPENDKFIRFVKVDGEIQDGISGKISDTINGDFWAEGPAPFSLNGNIYVYYDRYKDGCFGASVSSDGGNTWTDVADQISLPKGIRHGSVIHVSEKLIESLK